MKGNFRYAGVAVCLILMTIPLVFMPFFGFKEKSGYQAAEPFPSLILPGGGLNVRFPSEFEQWYQERFAFREPLIALNSLLNLRLFHTSQIEDVIVGHSDMLFYAPTVPDFEDKEPLSAEELSKIAENLERMHSMLQDRQTELYIAIAPNKNTIYPENMPSAFRFRETGGNQDRLYEALSGTGIYTIDLREPLLHAKQTSDVYYLTDTHWNCSGASAAVKELLAHIKKQPYPDVPVPNIFSAYAQGDLARMLGLQGVLTERAPDFSDARVFDKGINYSHSDFTLRGEGEGRLLVFRDSFTISAAPLLHAYFAETTFRWETPFDITNAGDFDAVLILIVERNIRTLMETPIYNAGGAIS